MTQNYMTKMYKTLRKKITKTNKYKAIQKDNTATQKDMEIALNQPKML